MSTWLDYLNQYKDVATYVDDARQAGIDTGTAYNTAYNQNTTGWEQEWLNRTNQRLGTNYTDASQLSREALAQTHYENWGKGESREYGAGDNYFDTEKFQTLLSKLEDSKGRQQRQKSLEGRRDTYAGGLSGMMSNF